MSLRTKAAPGMSRRPKMEPPTEALRDEARARVEASGKPSLSALRRRLGGWDVPEVSGRIK